MFYSKNKKNKYTLVNPNFYYIKVGCNGVFTTRTCYHDESWGLSAVNNLYRELGSNYLLISRDFRICMVIRAIYFKVFALANR